MGISCGLEITNPGAGVEISELPKASVARTFKSKVATVQSNVSVGPRLASSKKVAPSDVYRPRPTVIAPQVNEMVDVESIQAIISLVDGGNWQEAERKLRDYIKANPKDEGALVEMAMIQLIDKKDPAAAKPFLEKAVASNLNNSSILSELLAVYEETNTVEDGILFLKSLKDKMVPVFLTMAW